MTLNDFIQRHQKMDKREVKAEGVDSDGNPVTFEYELHERKFKGHETAGDVEACYELSLKFVREIDKELEWRMRDLAHLEGSKLGEKLRRSTKDFSGTNPGEALFADDDKEGSSDPVT
ncbi:unnamed protein product [Closterium sp. NIES-65]|nr:unnamed protein product [Closterium sp. NIES-65]